MFNIIKCSLLLCCLYSVQSLTAQNLNDWQAYQKVKEVNDVLDYQGLTYLATDAGIFIVDPNAPRQVQHLAGHTANLPSNRVEALAIEPSTQALIIGTYDLGVFRAGENDDWEAISYPESLISPLHQTLTYCLEYDTEDRLVVGTNKGLYRLEADMSWTHYGPNETNNFLHAVWSMVKRPNGNLVAGGNIMIELTSDSFNILNPNLEPFESPNLFAYGDLYLHQTAQGVLWAFNDLGEAGRYEEGQWEIFSPHESGDPDQFFSSTGFSISQGDTLWTYIPNHGYRRYTNGNWEDVDNYLSLNNPEFIFKSFNETFGFAAGHLYQLAPNQAPAHLAELDNWPWEATPFASQNDADHQTWVRLGTNQLLCLSNGNTLEINFTAAFNSFAGYTFGNQANELWVWRGKTAYQLIDGSLNQQFELTSTTLPHTGIRQLIISDDQTPWMYTSERKIYVLENGNWELVYSLADQEYIYGFFPGENNTIRLVSFGNGQLKFQIVSPTNGNTIIPHPTALDQGFNGVFPGDEALELWFTDVNGQRLHQFSPEGHWSNLPYGDGTQNHELLRTVQEIDDRLLVTGRHSIGVYDGEQWAFYTPQNSPLDGERITNGHMDHNGTIWLFHAPLDIIERIGSNLLTNTRESAAETGPLKLQFWPNPVRRTGFTNAGSNDSLSIWNMEGKLMQRLRGASPIDLAGLPAGTYILVQEQQNGKKRNLKFVKE